METFNLPAMALRGKRRKSIILRPIDTSPALRTDLNVTLNGLVRRIMSWTKENVVPVIIEERRAYAIEGQRGDGAFLRDDAGDRVRSIIELLRREAEAAETAASRGMFNSLWRFARRHTKKWIAIIRGVTQIDVGALLTDADLVEFMALRSEVLVGLIKNVSDDMIYQINREVLGSIFEGRSNADIAKSLQKIDGISRSRAKLIARDQASKHNAALNQFRQEQAGVKRYRWSTILDGRERATHRANNGRIFAWAKPPATTGHPGDDINCRCRGLAVLAEFKDD